MVTRSLSDGHALNGLIEWEGQRDSSVVPEWLNAASTTESYARVVKLIEEIRHVEGGVSKALRAGWYMGVSSQPKPKAIVDQLIELDRKHVSINEMLKKYNFSPVITRVLQEGRWMLSMFSASEKDDYIFHRIIHEENKRLSDGSLLVESHCEYLIGEPDVVLRILNIAASSELERLQQCKHCSKWFYAQRSHQKFCSEECRLANYSSSTKYKNYRKLYMRRHRAKHPAIGTSGLKRKAR